ncbi:MAG: hypothetical protein ACJ746_07390 [Bryobacteraceae bacterium]
MLKKFGALGLMLTAGLLFVHPSLGEAQDRYGRSSYYGYDDRGHDHQYREHQRQRVREEREARKWREKELREREKWERRNYRDYYGGYEDHGRPSYGYRDPYRPY